VIVRVAIAMRPERVMASTNSWLRVLTAVIRQASDMDLLAISTKVWIAFSKLQSCSSIASTTSAGLIMPASLLRTLRVSGFWGTLWIGLSTTMGLDSCGERPHAFGCTETVYGFYIVRVVHVGDIIINKTTLSISLTAGLADAYQTILVALIVVKILEGGWICLATLAAGPNIWQVIFQDKMESLFHILQLCGG